MTDKKTTDLTALIGATLADSDLIVVVDVDDATMDPTGTDKQITKAQLVAGMGAPVVRKFSFAYNTANILTGASLYTPTIGDVLLQIWAEITTPWNGTTPHLQVGTFLHGIGTGVLGTGGTDLTNAASEYPRALSAGALSLGYWLGPGMLTSSGIGWPSSMTFVPEKFTEANPIQVSVSQTGTAPQAPFLSAGSAPTVPLTVVAGVNDQFVFDSNTYTMAAGTYSTAAAVATAVGAALHSGTPLSSLFATITSAFSFDGLYFLWASTGTAGNGKTFNTGTHDVLASLGINNGDALASGVANGGDPGSTQGAGILYLVTATPI